MKIFQPGMAKQIFSHLLSHFYIVLIGVIFGFSLLSWVIGKPVYEVIFSVVFSLLYFLMVYKSAWDIAAHDKKPYVDMQPYTFKGAVLSIGILLLNLILWLMYKYSWSVMAVDGALATYTGIFYNAVYVFNTFMYTGFIHLSNGHMSWYGHIIIYAVPLAASTLGYIAGLHEFTLMDKLMPYMYEKKKD